MLRALEKKALESRIATIAVVGPFRCWRAVNKPKDNGYVEFRLHYKLHYAHRAVYEALIGPIPIGLQLDHLCRNTWCCNPNHVEPVTGQVNTLRGATISAAHAAKTACINGHPFDHKNTYRHGPGKRWRRCRTCLAR